ncbi:fungal specific transcription factor [Colletotrichum truncatum]|uniref:Fungal specific transcription factor n=1 Tax=Colletotrichum truncatum TaxID=5467 RepID=A0ACC3YTC3_COLTU|nr:fungal specific transcription factor [Colletotrichum truncatum]KAF6798375.1 fungal specific transcription factor [Colletotrichum truncatum]
MEQSPEAQLSPPDGQAATRGSDALPRPRPLACTPCRRRKIRCDHKTPICSNCVRYGLECAWPEGRRSSGRRQRPLYEDVVSRLAQMERLVEELQSTKPDQGMTPPTNEASTSSISPLNTVSTPAVAPAVAPAVTPSSMTASVTVSASQSPISRRKASSASPSSGNPDTHPSPTSATSSTGARPYYVGAPNEQVVAAAGACSLLSPQGLAQIELLIGDSRFTNALNTLQPKLETLSPQPYLEPSDVNNPLPPNHVIMDCVNDYMVTMNTGIRLFQEHEVRAALSAYFQGQPIADPGWRLAINSILAHTMRKRNRMRNKDESEKYIHNALGMIPNVIIRAPTPLTIGAMLSVILYYNFISENHIALTLLGLTVQLLLMSGYHRPDPDLAFADPQNLSPADHLHRRRLFWHAYVIDHDLMLRIGKPPLISDDFLLDLPEEHPADGYSMYYYPNNITLNFFLQQVRLAQIQGRISAALYSKSGVPPTELEAEIRRLDAELQEWRESIPEMIHPERVDALLDGDYHRLVCLTTLHFTYFQLVVAIHSTAFRLPAFEDQEGVETPDIGPSLALCVGASRAAISLLNFHQIEHPYTPYLIYQVAWSVDLLFVNILQNKTSPRARRDLELIRTVLSFFETYDPSHRTVISYQIISVIADVAASVLANTPTLPPHMRPVSRPVGTAVQVPPATSNQAVSPATAMARQSIGGFPPELGMTGTTPGRSGSINGASPDVLGPMTSLTMSDQQQQQQQGFVDMTALTPVTPASETPFMSGFMDIATDWRLPMDYQPELWQYDNILDSRYQNRN